MNRHTITGAPSLPCRDVELTIPKGGKIGQILVLTEKGPEWQDRRMVAQLKRDEDDRLYCDKTFNELYDAYNRGVDVQIEVDFGYNVLLSPMLIKESALIFENEFIESGELVSYSAIVNPDNLWDLSEYAGVLPTDPDSNTEE